MAWEAALRDGASDAIEAQLAAAESAAAGGGARLACDLVEGRSPLMVLCESKLDSGASVRVLLRHGADPTSSTLSGNSPLHRAAFNGAENCVRALLEHARVDVDASARDKKRPLHLACAKGNTAIARRLLDAGAAPNHADGVACAIHFAAKSGRADLVEELLGRSAVAAGTRDEKKRRTPLHYAAEAPEPDGDECAVVSALVAKGDDELIDAEDMLGDTALSLAAAAGSVVRARQLLSAGANAGARNRRGWLPLHHSAAKGHADVTVVLLGGAADAKLVNELDQKGRAPLYLAALKGSAPTVRALLAAGADRALQDKETAEIALHGAAKMGDVECVRSLLDDEHGLLVRDKSSWLAVHHAAAAGHAGALEVLLAHEPKLLELTTGEGLDTLLHLACARDQLECVAVLFREMKQRDLLAASADKRNSGGRTPLFAAADGNDGRGDGGAQRSREGERCTRITRGLLRAGATLNCQDRELMTPLHAACAAANPNVDAARELLRAGAPLSLSMSDGRLALHFACESEPITRELVRELLSRARRARGGANLDADGARDALENLAKQFGDDPLLAEEVGGEALPLPPDTNAMSEDLAPLASSARDAVCEVLLARGGADDAAAWHRMVSDDKHAASVEALVHALTASSDASGACDAVEARARITRLAEAEDGFGRSAYRLAATKCRRVIESVLFFCGQYKLSPGAPLHASPSSIVVRAEDLWASGGGDGDRGSAERGSFRVGSSAVVIKFMRSRDQWRRECIMRNLPVDGAPSDETRPNLDPKLVMAAKARGDAEFQAAARREGRGDYVHGLVMEAAERNLLSVFQKENMSIDSVRFTMMQLGECLKHMHEMGVIHGDVKATNAVRVTGTTSAASWKLVDLDAATAIGTPIGSKCSASVVPPEMIVQRPLGDGETAFVVRSLAGGDAVDNSVESLTRSLGYEPCLATPQFDLWSFGTVLFQLLTGKSLFFADVHDNIGPADMRRLGSWKVTDAEEAAELVRSVLSSGANSTRAAPQRTTAACDLISWLLQPRPADRPPKFDDVLKHAFFSDDPNRGEQWEREVDGFFLSYAQHSGGQTARALAKRLQDLGHHVWIDIDMNEPSKQEMTRGIRRHKTFLLFLTKGSLLREFCQYELRLAIRLQKQIVIVDEEPSPHPDRGGALAFQTYIDDAQRGDDVFCDKFSCSADETERKLGPIRTAEVFQAHASIPFFRDDEFRRESLNEIIERAGYSRPPSVARAVASGAPLSGEELPDNLRDALALIRRQHVELQQLRSTASGGGSGGGRLLLVYDPGETDGTILRLKDHLKDLCTWPIEIMSDSPVTESHTVLLFLTKDVLRHKGPENALLEMDGADHQENARRWRASVRDLILVRETDERHGAAASLDELLNAPGAPPALVDRVRLAAGTIDGNRPWGSTIPYHARIPFRQVSLQKIVHAWQKRDSES